jgi:hypothetical protein
MQAQRLLDGSFDESDSHASFLDAIKEWRQGADAKSDVKHSASPHSEGGQDLGWNTDWHSGLHSGCRGKSSDFDHRCLAPISSRLLCFAVTVYLRCCRQSLAGHISPVVVCNKGGQLPTHLSHYHCHGIHTHTLIFSPFGSSGAGSVLMHPSLRRYGGRGGLPGTLSLTHPNQ